MNHMQANTLRKLPHEALRQSSSTERLAIRVTNPHLAIKAAILERLRGAIRVHHGGRRIASDIRLIKMRLLPVRRLRSKDDV